MKRISLLLSLLLLTAAVPAQDLSQVTFSGGTTLAFFTFKTDQAVLIRISEEGQILEWGTDPGPGRYYTDTRRLLPYAGRVEYYGQEADSAFRGKVRYIGTCAFTYYGKFENTTKAGKLKTLGRNTFDYYDNFENTATRGKIKSAGSLSISFYTSYDNEAFRGKLKSVGSNQLTWYSNFDDKKIQGKIKSIGSFNYTWYSSYEQYSGSLKSGSIVQPVNGITFIIM
jgi:hypothetical protein